MQGRMPRDARGARVARPAGAVELVEVAAARAGGGPGRREHVRSARSGERCPAGFRKGPERRAPFFFVLDAFFFACAIQSGCDWPARRKRNAQYSVV